MDNTEQDLDNLSPEERAKLMALVVRVMQHQEMRAQVVGVVNAKNNRSYYNEKAGMDILPQVDDMIKDGIELEFPYQSFQENNNWTANTLFQHVQQAVYWLADHYDPDHDGRYVKFKKDVKFTQRKGDTGVRILWKDHVKYGQKPGGMFAGAKKVGKQENLMAWREQLIAWMSQSDGPKALNIENLSLRQDDINYVTELLASSEGTFFILMLEPNRIKIGRK